MVMLKPKLKMEKPRLKKEPMQPGQFVSKGAVTDEVKPFHEELSGTISPHMKSARTQERQNILKKSVLEDMADANP